MTVVLAVGGISSAHSVALSRGAQLVHVRTHRHHTMLAPDQYAEVIDVSHLANRPLSQFRYALKEIAGMSFDAMLCLHDESVVLGARLAESLGLAFASINTAMATVDKALMRNVLAQDGLNSVRYGVVADGDIIWATAAPKGPVVLKPSSGRASLGVQLLPDVDSVLHIIKKHPLEYEGFLVEERKIGTEYSVESVLLSVGEWHGITSKITSGAIETGHIHPAPIDEMSAHTVRSTVIMALECLGIKSGLLHTEVIVDTHGSAHIVETHLRGGGDGILDLVALSTGINLTELYVDDVLKRLHEFPHSSLEKVACCQYSLPSCSGILTGWSGLERAKHCDGVVDVGTIPSIGDWIQPEQKSSYTRLAWAIATADDAQSAQDRALGAVDGIVPHVVKAKE